MSAAVAHAESRRLRSARARVKRALWAGQISFADVDLGDPDLARMRIAELLSVLPYTPQAANRTPRRTTPALSAYLRANALMDAFGARHDLRVGALSASRQEQLRRLVAASVHPIGRR